MIKIFDPLVYMNVCTVIITLSTTKFFLNILSASSGLIHDPPLNVGNIFMCCD